MGEAARITPRQIWASPTTTGTKSYSANCTPFVLPSTGLLFLNLSYSVALTENAIYEPLCTGGPSKESHAHAVLDTRDPFYSSLAPQIYVIGCTTVISYLLVIILFITPRTFYVGGPGGGASFLGRHGMISGSYSGSSSVVGAGGRPWLQKVAAILVAISLTIASAESFGVARSQYIYGYSDAQALSEDVLNGMEIRIFRVISTTFLWLAQVQTLIRLFPRHTEKIMIMWAGFVLIVFDITFSVLDNFLVKSDSTHPRLFDDAISAVSYVFEIALSLLYAAWVIFYSLSKHRFAFFHPKMRNICLVALLSLCAVLTPITFFVLDIAVENVAGWGSYVRWVGSAAGSVVVWEWVERIEALERDERKDGILGREIFDGDEMLDVTPSEEVDWPRQSLNGAGHIGRTGSSSGWGGMMNSGNRPLRARVGARRHIPKRRDDRAKQGNLVFHNKPRTASIRPNSPLANMTPASTADTISTDTTIYGSPYHSISDPTPAGAVPRTEEESETEAGKEMIVQADLTAVDSIPGNETDIPTHHALRPENGWRSLLHPFRRGQFSLPMEVASAQAEEDQSSVTRDATDDFDEGSYLRREVRFRLDHLLYLRKRSQGQSRHQSSEHSLPVTIIPSRHRDQQTWQLRLFDDSSLAQWSQQQDPGSDHVSDHSNTPNIAVSPQNPYSTPRRSDDGEARLGSPDCESDHGDVPFANSSPAQSDGSHNE